MMTCEHSLDVILFRGKCLDCADNWQSFCEKCGAGHRGSDELRIKNKEAEEGF